jgi:hypothetical protein
MKELHIASQSEITFSFKERKFALSTKVGWKYEKSIKFGWQFPFTFPSVPCIQVRIGIKIQLGFTIAIGIQIDIKYEKNKADFVISFYVTFTIGLRLSITAEAGAFTGVVSAYAGIEGVLLDVTAQFKFYVYFNKLYYEFYPSFTITALQFRVYIEGLIEINLLFHKIRVKKVFFEKGYGLTTPLMTIYYYVKLNFKSQVLEEKKESKLYLPSVGQIK